MNPRQRRGVLLLALAGVGAVAVFFAVVSYVAGVRKQVTPKTTVLTLTQNLPAHAEITPAMVQAKSVPQHYAPVSAVHSWSAVAGKVAGSSLQAGSFVQAGMLEPKPALAPGQQALTILVDAETGVAGNVAPGDFVDIEAAIAGDPNSAQKPRAETVVPGARVIAVGQPREKTTSPAGVGATSDPSQQLPVTFALYPHDSLEVTKSRAFADEVRLALLRPGDEQQGGKRRGKKSRFNGGSK